MCSKTSSPYNHRQISPRSQCIFPYGSWTILRICFWRSFYKKRSHTRRWPFAVEHMCMTWEICERSQEELKRTEQVAVISSALNIYWPQSMLQVYSSNLVARIMIPCISNDLFGFLTHWQCLLCWSVRQHFKSFLLWTAQNSKTF